MVTRIPMESIQKTPLSLLMATTLATWRRILAAASCAQVKVPPLLRLVMLMTSSFEFPCMLTSCAAEMRASGVGLPVFALSMWTWTVSSNVLVVRGSFEASMDCM